MASIYCESNLTDHDNLQCDQWNMGGVTEWVIFKDDATTTDYTDGTTILADIAAGRAFLATGFALDMPAAIGKTIADPVFNTPSTVGYDRTLTITDWQTTANNNNNHYNDLNRFVAKAFLLYEPLSGTPRSTLVSDTDNGIRFDVSRIIPQSNGEAQSFAGTAAWSAYDMPTIQEIPVGVFNQ